MAANEHRNLDGDNLHVSKGFTQASTNTFETKDGNSETSWDRRRNLPPCLNYVSGQSAPPTTATGDIYIVDGTGTAYDINTVAWQSATTVRYTFNGSPDLSSWVATDYLVVSGSTNSVNNGTFVISAVDNTAKHIEVTNALVTDATDDESSDATGTAYVTLAAWGGANKYDHATKEAGGFAFINTSEGDLAYDLTLESYRLHDGTDFDSSLGGGGSSLWTQSGSDIYYNSGNVGIGTTPISGKALAVDGNSVISGQLDLNGTADSKLKLISYLHPTTGEKYSNYMEWYKSDGTTRRGYVGFTEEDTFRINVQESGTVSQIILDADEVILNSTSETQSATIKSGVWEATPIADAYIAEDYVAATSGAAQRIAVFDGTDSVEGDANLTYTGSTLKINSNNALSPNNFSSITGNYLASQVETDDANCLLYGYGTSNSGELILASARGTIASATAVQSGDSLGEVQGFGHSGTGFRLGGRMLFLAGENYQEGTNYGTTFSLRLTPNGSTAAVTRYEIDGNGDHTFTGDTKITGGLEVASTSQGLQIPRWTSAQETTNTSGWSATEEGTTWFNTTTKQFMGWNGSSSVILG